MAGVNPAGSNSLSQHSCRSIKKPASGYVLGGPGGGDQDSQYTGKSFYETPKEQEETKKLINSQLQQETNEGLQRPKYLIRNGVKTPIHPLGGKQQLLKKKTVASVDGKNLPFKYRSRGVGGAACPAAGPHHPSKKAGGG